LILKSVTDNFEYASGRSLSFELAKLAICHSDGNLIWEKPRALDLGHRVGFAWRESFRFHGFLLLPPEHRAKALRQYQKYLHQALTWFGGAANGLKPDGSTYVWCYHRAVYGPEFLSIMSDIVRMLDGTPYEISDRAYATLRLVALRTMLW
jgi:hypothetical protein